jgi:hypothetical protein
MRKRKLSFLVAFLYVLLGTVYGLLFPVLGNPVELWEQALFTFFLPVSFLIMILSSGKSDYYGLILVIQLILFFIIWLLIWLVFWIYGRLRPPGRFKAEP